MINKQELRIGNYVNWNADKPIFKIEELRENIAFLKSDKMMVTAPYADLQAIPLTSEVLESMGFREIYKSLYTHNYDLYTNTKFGAGWDLQNKIFHVRYIGEKLYNIRYLHELQNLYFSLTGHELEAKQKTA